MINQIRADFYRQRHTLGIILVLALSAVYAALSSGFQSVGGIIVNAPAGMIAKLANKHWTVLDSVRGATISSSVLLYLFIALFVIVVGYEFSQKTYKNTLVSGISRLGFVFGKYVVLFVDILAGMVWYYAIVLLTSFFAGRHAGASIAKVASFTGMSLVALTFFITVVFSLALVLLILTKSLVLSAIFIVVWPIVVATVTAATSWHWLVYVDFLNVGMGISFRTLSTTDTWWCVLISLIVLCGSILTASGIIRRQEL